MKQLGKINAKSHLFIMCSFFFRILANFESHFLDLLLRSFPHQGTLLLEVTNTSRLAACRHACLKQTEKECYVMKISRRNFLRSSALAGVTAALAGAAPLTAGAAAPAGPSGEENCLDSIGTAVASLGNGTPVLPSVVELSRGAVMGYCDNGIYTFKST